MATLSRNYSVFLLNAKHKFLPKMKKQAEQWQLLLIFV